MKFKVKFTNESETKFSEYIVENFIIPHVGDNVLIDTSVCRIKGKVLSVSHNIMPDYNSYRIHIVIEDVADKGLLS